MDLLKLRHWPQFKTLGLRFLSNYVLFYITGSYMKTIVKFFEEKLNKHVKCSKMKGVLSYMGYHQPGCTPKGFTKWHKWSHSEITKLLLYTIYIGLTLTTEGHCLALDILTPFTNGNFDTLVYTDFPYSSWLLS